MGQKDKLKPETKPIVQLFCLAAFHLRSIKSATLCDPANILIQLLYFIFGARISKVPCT